MTPRAICKFLGMALLLAVAGSGSTTAPSAHERIANPFPGVRHIHRTQTSPRRLDMHIVEIDLTTPGLGFKITEPNGDDAPGDWTVETPREFLKRNRAQIAINAGSYYPDPKLPHASNYYLGVSDGVRFSPFRYGESAINISPDNVVTVIDHPAAQRQQGQATYQTDPPVELYNAIGAKNRILANGVNVGAVHYNGFDCDKSCSARDLHPRTAIGVTADKKLLLFVVDGRRKDHSMGMTTAEVADVLAEYGAVDAVNLDGGGSTQLVLADPEPRLVNKPSDPQERAVGGNLAVLVPTKPR